MRLVVATVLYGARTPELDRWIRAVRHAGSTVLDRRLATRVDVRIGDCGSPDLEIPLAAGSDPRSGMSVDYRRFGANLGHSKGCNLLAATDDVADDDVLILLNPDALPEELAFVHLIEALKAPNVGVVDARQIPFEHPKWFDPRTGDQSWASGACLGMRHALFLEVGGFDDAHFWSYCNDVDLSWRVRLRGFAAIHVPEAVVFHDKQVDGRGQVIPTSTQDYYSLLGRLSLAARFGRPDLARKTSKWVQAHGSPAQRAALAAFQARVAAGSVPRVLPGAGAVAQFHEGEYAHHRF